MWTGRPTHWTKKKNYLGCMQQFKLWIGTQPINKKKLHLLKIVSQVVSTDLLSQYRHLFRWCVHVSIFFVWRGKLWFPGGGIKTSHRLFLIFFFLNKKKICISFWCYTATSRPPTARAVGGRGTTVFSLYNHKLPRNHGLSRDTAMLSPFTHTHTHCGYTLWHMLSP